MNGPGSIDREDLSRGLTRCGRVSVPFQVECATDGSRFHKGRRYSLMPYRMPIPIVEIPYRL